MIIHNEENAITVGEKMAHVKPQIPKELAEIIIPEDSEIKLKSYPANYAKYQSLDQLTQKDASKKDDHEFALSVLESSKEQLIELSERLWASKNYAVLIVLQGMDTAGKDGTINHVLSGLNPQSCRVSGFKVPSEEEIAHNFLWRYSNKLPKRGEIVIFNRSYYENILVTKVHPSVMETLPEELSEKESKNFWDDRYKDINSFEKHLARNGVLILKFFLYISKDEQKTRLLERLTNEDKYWKVSPADLKEREYWDKYITAYEDMLSNTSKECAPWILVPSNDKKIARAIVAYSVTSAISALKIEYPKVGKEDMEFLRKAKQHLESET